MPSSVPSKIPTSSPSDSPSVSPSAVPTFHYSLNPSESPSIFRSQHNNITSRNRNELNFVNSLEQEDERSNGGIIPTLVIVVCSVVGTLTAVGSIFIIYKKLTKRNPATRSEITGGVILSNTTRRTTGQSIAQSRDRKSSKGKGSENDDDVWRVLDFDWNNSLKETQSHEYRGHLRSYSL